MKRAARLALLTLKPGVHVPTPLQEAGLLPLFLTRDELLAVQHALASAHPDDLHKGWIGAAKKVLAATGEVRIPGAAP